MSKSTKAKACCMDLGRDLSVDIYDDLKRVLGHKQWDNSHPCAEGYLIDSFLSKHPALDHSNNATDRRELAIAKLFSSDSKCSNINESGFLFANFSQTSLNGLLKTAQSLIGNLVSGFEHSLLSHCNFSNGASIGFKLRDAAPYKKFAGKATVTVRAYDLAVRVVKTDPQWLRYMQDTWGDETSWFTRVPGNSVFTVPKNSKIDRAAAKEPCLNMYLQKGAGAFIRTRLRKFAGIDLNDQSRNQILARRASIDGSLATIDLSSASDSISNRLVWELLPESLFEYLDLIRSHRALMPDGTCKTWSLFSTMGNGFTFELESLIFWALAKSVALSHGVTGDIGIYGDDIVVPTEIAEELIALLACVGFLPNKEKTFTSGPFRESCGGHYLNGIDIKPIYVRREISDLPSLMLILNRLRGWHNVSGISDPRIYDVWVKYAKLVPEYLMGGCDINRDDYLVTPDYPRKRIVRVSRTITGFNHKFSSNDDNGRLINWYHNGAGEISATISANQFAVMANKEWSTTISMFPQEL